MVGKLKQQVGEAQAKKLLSEAVYLFNIAGNDYVVLIQKNVKKLPVSNFKKRRQMNMIIGNLTSHIKVSTLFLYFLLCFFFFKLPFGLRSSVELNLSLFKVDRTIGQGE